MAPTFYKEAWDLIYGEFQEGKKEEFVHAAARYALLKIGLASQARSLRSLKLLYFSRRSGKTGAPLAAVFYDSLTSRPDFPERFDYDRFIAGEFSAGRLRPGRLAAYRKAIQPVSGLAGMVVKEDPAGAKVEKVFADFPAARAGIKLGDLLVSARGTSLAGKDLDAMLDLLAGKSGSRLEVVIRGFPRDRRTSLTLK